MFLFFLLNEIHEHILAPLLTSFLYISICLFIPYSPLVSIKCTQSRYQLLQTTHPPKNVVNFCCQLLQPFTGT